MIKIFERKKVERWALVTALVGLLFISPAALHAATPLQDITHSPDITLVLGGVTVNDEDPALDELAGTISLLDIGSIPSATDLNAYHVLADGDQLISFDITVVLDGLTASPGDAVRVIFSGGYDLEFEASANNLPSGVLVDALSEQNGELLLSFDTTVVLEGSLTVDDEDLVSFDGSSFSLFFDGSAAGVSPALDLDAAHYLQDKNRLLLSFDGSGMVDSVYFDDEDLLEYDFASGSWEFAYDGSGQHANWPVADLNAAYAVVAPPTTQTDLWAVEYRWGDPAPGYSFADWPIFEGWMNVRIENRGAGDAFNVTGEVMSWPDNTEMPDPSVTVGDIPAGGSAWSVDTFTTRVDMDNPGDPCDGIFWRIEYEDAGGGNNVIDNVPEFPPGEGPCD